MAKEFIKVEIMEKQIVKPSSPTPHLLRTLNLSVIDQMMPPVYVPTILYYSSDNNTTTKANDVVERHNYYCQRLIRSLPKVLTHFYPLAGRPSRDNPTIQCNDDGAEFVTAQVHCPLSNILRNPDPEMLAKLCPTVVQEEADDTSLPLFVVQANMFDCGGLAIGLMLSHKIGDASTFSALITFWAKTALHDEDDDDMVTSSIMLPKFDAAAYFPPIDPLKLPPVVRGWPKIETTTRRFVFDAPKITALQSKLASSSSPSSSPPTHVPTRVQSVLVLLWKCAMEASARPSTLRLSVDLRKWIGPPIQQNLAGNFLGYLFMTSSPNIDDDLVAKLREGIERVKETYAAERMSFDSNEEYGRFQDYLRNMRENGDMDHFVGTSWCRFPFYEYDFGWGKPTWMSIDNMGRKNMFLLVDQRDCKGIEAWVILSPETMNIFESNAELLTYATVNPSVIA